MAVVALALLIAVAAIVGLFTAVDWAVELLWLDTLGYASVFWTLRALKVGFFLAAFVPGLVYFWLNLRFLSSHLDLGAVGRAVTGRLAGYAGSRGAAPPPPGFYTRGGGPTPAALVILPAVAIALVLGWAFYGQWDVLLRFQWSQAYGRADPIYGRDIGFYLFALPLLELVQTGTAIVAFAGTGLLLWGYTLSGTISVGWPQGVQAPAPVLWHLALNMALFFAAFAWGFYLDRFALLQSAGGAVYGAGYTDVHVVRPGLWVLAGVTIALAVAVLFPRFFGKAAVSLTALAGYLAVLIVCRAIVPWVVQGLVVEPNELRREEPFLRHNIAFTREAFGLSRVEERPYRAVDALTLAVLRRNRQTVDNIRLWDWRPLSQTFRQLQRIRSYYEITDVDVDRYRIDGKDRQVMLSARELAENLPERSDTWLNRRLQYTHGYGLAMSLTTDKAEDGAPVLIVKDLPPRASGGLSITQPAIYYGSGMSGYRIVATAVKELDYPKGDENVYTRYAGRGGIPIDSLSKKLLFAWHQLDISILLTGYITPQSRIQLWRAVRDRVERIAPFLRLDADPYLVLSEGRLYWIQDAYTVSRAFPYAEPHGDAFNYIRNSVKVVVDAYDGGVVFYVVDAGDPVLRVYREALPALFRGLAEMPEGLRRHLRYPQDLFKAQMAKYNVYHMTVPQVFYNREDVWAVPREKYGGEQIRMEPYYVLIRLPGERRLQFLLMMPLTPRNRDNMIAWMAARSDFPGYGELIVYKLPKDHLILGPIQIEAKIDQDTLISQQLSLWDQRGSRVIRGNLLVIPIAQSFIYVEPVYLIAEGTNIPQLKRIIVSDGSRMAMEPTLHEAIAAVFGERRPVAERPPSGRPERAPAARQILERAEEALGAGDWDAFGRAMQELKGILED